MSAPYAGTSAQNIAANTLNILEILSILWKKLDCPKVNLQQKEGKGNNFFL